MARESEKPVENPIDNTAAREEFLRTLAIGLDRFNMSDPGHIEVNGRRVMYNGIASGVEVAEALAAYRSLKAEAAASKVEFMGPHPTNILWVYGTRFGRYLVYPFDDKNSIHLAFGFCLPPKNVKAEYYSSTCRPSVSDTFQLKLSYTSDYKYWDSRPKKKSFSVMKDGREEFVANISRLMFGGNLVDGTAYVEAMEQRLFILKGT